MREMAATASAEALARARAMSSLFAAVVLVLVLVSSSANGGSVNDCHGVRYAYRERGLDLKDVPRQPRQGKAFSTGFVETDFSNVCTCNDIWHSVLCVSWLAKYVRYIVASCMLSCLRYIK